MTVLLQSLSLMFSSSLTALPGSVPETDVTLSEVGHIHAHQLSLADNEPLPHPCPLYWEGLN